MAVTLCSLENVSQALPRGSPALNAYLTGVYGVAGAAAELVWDWSAVEVIRKRYLPSQLRAACSWPVSPAGRGSLYTWWAPSQLLWVYQFDTGCKGMLPSNSPWRKGAKALEVPGRWVEVTHAYLDNVSIEADVLFLTIAKGSGLWYYTGRTLVSNGASLADWMAEHAPNATSTRQQISAIGWPFTELRKMGFASVIEDAHVDYDYKIKEGRCTDLGFFKREVRERCPHLPLRRGLPPLHRPARPRHVPYAYASFPHFVIRPCRRSSHCGCRAFRPRAPQTRCTWRGGGRQIYSARVRACEMATRS